MKTKLRKKLKGFTLVELVIVIAIVIVLSVVSVPIYRSYIDKAKMSEGYALLGACLSAQKAYYSEYGNFLLYEDSCKWTSYDTVLGIDARGNKYFSRFRVGQTLSYGNPKTYFDCSVEKPIDLRESEIYGGEKGEEGRHPAFFILYNTNKGVKYCGEKFDSSLGAD